MGILEGGGLAALPGTGPEGHATLTSGVSFPWGVCGIQSALVCDPAMTQEEGGSPAAAGKQSGRRGSSPSGGRCSQRLPQPQPHPSYHSMIALFLEPCTEQGKHRHWGSVLKASTQWASHCKTVTHFTASVQMGLSHL